jgi:DNA-binding transcriptional ArsR family regulator
MNEQRLEKTLKALANRRRLAIMTHLKHVREAKVGDIATQINLSFAATSRHLVILERSGILNKEQRDKEVFYRIAQPIRALIREIITEL